MRRKKLNNCHHLFFLIMILHHLRLSAILLACVLASVTPLMGAPAQASRAELSRARYELDKVITKAKNHAGVPYDLSKADQRSFAEIQQLAERFPEDPNVQELVNKAREVYRQAKGERFVFTPEMLAYRQRGEKLADVVKAASDKRWETLKKEQSENGLLLAKPFPAPDAYESDQDQISGKKVILIDVPYEQDLFVSAGTNWIPVGSPDKGYYWINGSSQRFNRLFEGLRRYRSNVQQEVPEKWTFIAQVDEPEMMAPGSEADQIKNAYLGWIVNPTALYIPGVVLVELDENGEAGVTFAGESEIKSLLNYSVTSVADDVEPQRLVEIYITALKEKNFELHLDCIDPEQRKAEAQIGGLRYNWEIQQKGIEKIHVHAEPYQVDEIIVVSGGVNEGLEAFFGDPDNAVKPAFTKEEEVRVWVRLFDKDGVQSVRPRIVKLCRRDGGRWYITSGATLTF